MAVLNDGSALRKSRMGLGPVSKASGAITGDPTLTMFNVTGGDVLITALWLKVTTEIATNSGTLAVAANPTTGDTQTLVTATDLGTTNTAVGSVVGLTQGTTAASAFLRGGRIDLQVVATTGTLELIGAASVDGAVTMYVTYVPLTDGAVVAAA